MPAAPRIVFFGMPHTGKTGLLHAFADPEAPLPLSKYGDERTADLSRTLPDGTVLCDVDGRSAKEIIVDPRQIERDERTAKDVRDADAIVLALDASATGDATIELFHSFAAFLEGLEETRSKNREVGGLPVFLTLTKCDRLFQPGDDPSAWLHRVESKKRSVQTAFEDYLAATGHGSHADPFAFGSIEVHVAATALQFPKDPKFDSLDAPFGVEELRDRCSAAAGAHCRRADSSRRMLRWTLAGSGGLVGTMALALATLFALSPTPDEDRLGKRIRAYQEREGSPAYRLADRQFEKNRKELRAIRDDRAFETLPEEHRAFLDERLKEYDAYRDYRDHFHPPRIGPAEVRTRKELASLEADLDGVLKPPAEFAKAWAETEAVKLANKWRADAASIRTAETALHDWYRGLVRRGTALLVAPVLDSNWRTITTVLLAESEKPPFDRDATMVGSEKLPVPRGAAVKYSVAFEFDRVEQARADWLDAKGRVMAMRDLGDALGMTGSPDAILVFPEPTNDVSASAKLASVLLPKLGAVDWSISKFPDPIRGELQKRLRLAQESGAKHVHAVLRSRLGSESREAWAVAVKWFEEPDAKAWGQLLGRLGQWGEFEPTDPVADAVAFLKRDAFESDLTSLELTLPNDLRDRRLIPKGTLVIRAKLNNATTREFAFKANGEPQVTGTATVYRFVPDGHDGKPTFRPDEAVTVSMGLKAGDLEYGLDWDTAVSAVYSFERLSREPTLRAANANVAGERAAGVRLAAPNLPRLPLLLRLN